MDSLELTKIAGAVIAALLVIFGTKTFIEIREANHQYAETKAAKVAGYTLPMAKAGAAGAAPAAGGTAAPAGFDVTKVTELLAKANTDNGKATFKKCASCHTADQGGKNMVGPNLWGIAGRKAGAVDGFAYSDSLKAVGEWTPENLAKFVNNPKSVAAGTKMVFAGLSDPAEVADLVAYLKTLK